MSWEDELKKAVAEGDEVAADRVAAEALDGGAPALEVLEKGAVAGIYDAGRLWQEGEYFLPDIILATEAFNAAMKRLEPLLEEGAAGEKGTVAIGSVAGDAHDLGKNIVTAMLRSARYRVIDLGIDVSADRFVEAARQHGADAVGMGAYMTTTMRNMEGIIAALADAGLRDSVKVVVGGAAVTREYAEAIGADGYAADAAEAVTLLDRLLGKGA